MNDHFAYKRPISGWSRVLAGLLGALCLLGITLFVRAVSYNQAPRLGYHEILGIVCAGLFLVVCIPIALTGYPPRFWTRFEARLTTPATSRAPFWLRRRASPPRWAWRMGILLWICLALGLATILTIALSDLLDSRRNVVIVAVYWCVTLAVVGVLIKWWCADLPSRRSSSIDPNGDR
jgi:hypothetical protein